MIELKTRGEFFLAVRLGLKTAEIRLNDRDFKQWQLIRLKEIDDSGEYTGDSIDVFVTHILTSDEFVGLSDGYVMLSFKLLYQDLAE